MCGISLNIDVAVRAVVGDGVKDQRCIVSPQHSPIEGSRVSRSGSGRFWAIARAVGRLACSTEFVRGLVLGVLISLVLCFSLAAADGLMGYWEFEGNLHDSSGNGRHGSVSIGSAEFVPGLMGLGIRMTNDRVNIPWDHDDWDAFTVEVWFYLQNMTAGCGQCTDSDGCNIWMDEELNGPGTYSHVAVGLYGYRPTTDDFVGLSFTCDDGNSGTISGVNYAGGVTQYEWHQAVLTAERGGESRAYYDGQLVGTWPQAGWGTPGVILYLGGRGDWKDYNLVTDGILDEVGLYSRALSADEVESEYDTHNPQCAISSPLQTTHFEICFDTAAAVDWEDNCYLDYIGEIDHEAVLEEGAGNCIPDFVEAVALAMEIARDEELNGLGYGDGFADDPAEPVSGDVPPIWYHERYQVHIDSTWAEHASMVPDWGFLKPASHVVLAQEDTRFMWEVDGFAQLLGRCAEEYFHAIQYNALSSGWHEQEAWVVEGTALWAADTVVRTQSTSGSKLFHTKADNYLSCPSDTLRVRQPLNEREYKSTLYWYFLSENTQPSVLGYDTSTQASIVRSILSDMRGAESPDVIAAIEHHVGSSFDLIYGTFAQANYFQASWYPTPLPRLPFLDQIPLSSTGTSDSFYIENYGARYVTIGNTGSEMQGVVHVAFDGVGTTYFVQRYLGGAEGAKTTKDTSQFDDFLSVEDAIGTLYLIGRFDEPGSGVFSLSVRLLTPAGAIEALDDQMQALKLEKGTRTSLLVKLDAAKKALDRGNHDAALNQINAFLNYVRAQSGKKIPKAAAEALTANVEVIISAIRAYDQETLPNSTASTAAESEVLVFPNPVRDVNTAHIQIVGPAAISLEELWVRIFNPAGKLVWEMRTSSPELDWHINDSVGQLMANGVYLCQVQVKSAGKWESLGVFEVAVLR